MICQVLQETEFVSHHKHDPVKVSALIFYPRSAQHRRVPKKVNTYQYFAPISDLDHLLSSISLMAGQHFHAHLDLDRPGPALTVAGI